MVFSSFLFLFLFLPLVSLVYFACPRPAKNTSLLVASILFYGWGAPQVLPFLLLAIAFDFVVSLWILPGRLAGPTRRALFVFAIAANLSGLLYYKYFNFFSAEISHLFTSVGLEPCQWPAIALPIGISFFTFHKISYLGDVFRAKVAPSRSFVDYCLYILFFPQLIAGPIIRYADVAMQFRSRKHSIEMAFEGLLRFCFGLGKKVLIADSLGAVVDHILAVDPSRLTLESAWTAAFCYSFQIFFDFSGYSDMAIGLAKVFGFTFKENFDRPYRSTTFTDFWRRWHISLSTFMREYLYIPLGGNRGSAFRTHLNLWITFLLSGLWHGAAWNFIVWGAFHGAFLTIDRLGWQKVCARLPHVLSVSITFVLVTIGWVFFRANSVPHAFELLQVMSGFQALNPPELPRASIIDNRSLVVLGLAAIFSFAPRFDFSQLFWPTRLKCGEMFLLAARGCWAICIVFLSAAALASRGYTPFLYFRF